MKLVVFSDASCRYNEGVAGGAYVAAINRAQVALTEYRNVPAVEDALGILLNSYNALGMDQLRDDARRVLEKNYPQSVYLTQGFKARSQPWWKLW